MRSPSIPHSSVDTGAHAFMKRLFTLIGVKMFPNIVCRVGAQLFPLGWIAQESLYRIG